jgi:hypothetical protein
MERWNRETVGDRVRGFGDILQVGEITPQLGPDTWVIHAFQKKPTTGS